MSRMGPIQRKIIKRICHIEIQSLKRIMQVLDLDNPNLELLIVMSLEEIDDPEVFTDRTLENLNFFIDVYEKPYKVKNANKYQLSIMRHILNLYGSRYQSKWPIATAKLWERLFILSNQAVALEILDIQ